MRGYDRPQSTMLTLVNPEQRVPANHPGHGTRQFVTLTPQRSVANHLGEFIVKAGKSLFQPPDVLIDATV